MSVQLGDTERAAPAMVDPPDAAEVRLRLETILASSAFAHAPRAQQFLRFVVE